MRDPVDEIEKMLRERKWTRRHLLAVFGTSGRTSEVMNRRRPLTLNHIRCLVFNFNMDAELMIEWYPTDQQSDPPETTFNALSDVVNQ
jgi:HTH-type transcriptional regulator / antitoxin HigA